MKVVANSSCLIALSSSDLLYILKKLFGKVFVPRKVWEESLVPGKRGYSVLLSQDFIEVRDIVFQ